MKIAFVEPHLLVVGGIRRIVEVSNYLHSAGHDVVIYTPNGTPCSWMPLLVPVLKLSNKYKGQMFDIVIFNLAEQYKQALAIPARKHVFWVLAAEAFYKDPATPIKALNPGLFFFIANSKFVVQYIRKYVTVPYEIPIFPGGINPQHFRLDRNVEKRYHCLYYGSERPWKGKAVIEAAMSRIPKVKFLKMQGSDTPQEEIYKLYNQCRIYVAANLCEGFSMTQLEAMACGCVVVTTDDGGSRDYITHNYNAVIVPRSPEGIASGIEMVLGSESLYKKLRANGLATAAQSRFSWQNIGSAVEKHLQSLVR